MSKPRKPPARQLRVTVGDVAREADLGESTVRHCLSESPSKMYPEATVARVQAVAKKLGYRKQVGVTQKQLAEALGVSHTAVGMAFDPRGRISEELRQRVLAKAEELGYVYQGYQPRKQAVER